MKVGALLIVLLLWSTPGRAETLTWRECLRLAIANNPTLQSEVLNAVIAGEEVAQAQSGYLPRVDARLAYTLQKDPQAVIIMGRTAPTQEAEYASAVLVAEQTLYDFGRTTARVGRAKALQGAASASLEGLQQDIFLRTMAAYFGILEAEKLKGAAAQEVEQSGDHLRHAESLYEQGVVTRNDVLQAQVQLAASRQLLLARENELGNRWLLLNYLTGRPAEAAAELQEDIPFTGEELLDALPPVPPVAGRPELLSQRLVVAAGEESAKESRSVFWPTFFLRGGIDYTENRYVTEQAIYSAMVGLRVNLFDGLAKVSERRQAYEVLARERRRLHDLEGQAQLEYRTAANDARVAAARIRLAEEAIRQGEENLRINRNRYQEQVGTATEVIDAQTQLTRARTDYYRSIFDFQLAVARVKRAAGELKIPL